MSLIALIDAAGRCWRAVIAAGVAAGVAAVVVRLAGAAGGRATYENSISTAARCDAPL